MEYQKQDLEELSRQVRRDVVRMVHGAKSGHPGGALGMADVLVALYMGGVLRYKVEDFTLSGEGEDVFFLSNGHLSALWYSVLARSGFFPVRELATFRQLASRLQGHPTPAESLPGIRIASGSLGQGLSAGCGMALGKRLAHDAHSVFVLLGDGELQEGQVWEAAYFAASNALGGLVAMVDCNGLQIDGQLKGMKAQGDLRAKWESFGWDVTVADGSCMETILATLLPIREQSAKAYAGGKPRVILWETCMGQGVDFMENDCGWHGKAPNDEECTRALEQLTPTRFGDY